MNRYYLLDRYIFGKEVKRESVQRSIWCATAFVLGCDGLVWQIAAVIATAFVLGWHGLA